MKSVVALEVPIEAYNATNWNASAKAPSQDAVRDKIESFTGAVNRVIAVVDTATTLAAALNTDYVYFVREGATITLPDATGSTNQYTIKNQWSANITINTTTGKIEGETSAQLAPNAAITIVSDGVDWSVV